MVLSEKIKNILRAMENSIANTVLTSTVETPYDYIDITKDNDVVSFISSVKREEFLSKVEVQYRVIDDSKYLTHSTANSGIFKRLGYKVVGDRPERLRVGAVGRVVKETVSKSSGNTFCLFEYTIDGSPVKNVAINKNSLRENEVDTSFLWSKSRNSIKIGRMVRSILTHSGITFIEKDIEDFVNQFKSMYDLEQNALKKFSLIKEKDISTWYDKDNYIKGCSGQLYNSCMKGVPGRYFKFYKDNGVKMLVQFTDGGKLEKGKYTSDKIKGRALVWEGANIEGIGEVTLLDRIYTHSDSDIDLFREYAKVNGWYWKDRNGYFTNGSVIAHNNRVSFKLKRATGFRSYPYVDTLRYVDSVDGVAHTGHLKYNIMLGRTDGGVNNNY